MHKVKLLEKHHTRLCSVQISLAQMRTMGLQTTDEMVHQEGHQKLQIFFHQF